MPWLVGDENAYRIVDTGPELVLADLMSGPESLYLGYLLEGFRADLLRERVPGPRMALAFKAGWRAVAVTARTPDAQLALRLGPYLAPTTPRPLAGVPMGFALFAQDGLSSVSASRNLPSLEWACRLANTINQAEPAFCDPVLEMSLEGLTESERAAWSYRPPAPWRRWAGALSALARTHA